MSDPDGSSAGSHRIVFFATQGAGSEDELRIEELLRPLGATKLPFARTRRALAAVRLVGRLVQEKPDLVVVEGTGVAGGGAVIAARCLAGIPYVVSSGDAVTPFVRLLAPALGPVAAVYERLLCRGCEGFIAWSPYLAGRALTLGAPRAMTAANWAPPHGPAASHGGDAVRARHDISPQAIVFGIVGSLRWSKRRHYCYGLELVRAVQRTRRDDLVALVVGGGDGLARLESEAGPRLGRSVVLTGAVPRDEVPSHLAAMDVACLPQSRDAVGYYRYTTKLSEYLSARLPVVTGRLPFAYDLDDGWLWRLPGTAPWDERYVDALATLMETVDQPAIVARRQCVPGNLGLFDRERQQRHVCDFIAELLEEVPRKRG